MNNNFTIELSFLNREFLIRSALHKPLTWKYAVGHLCLKNYSYKNEKKKHQTNITITC